MLPPSRLAPQRRETAYEVVAVAGYQITGHQPLPDHASSSLDHHGLGVSRPQVVARSELADIAVKVLRRDVVKRAMVAALERGPEGLDPVGVSLVADVLGDGVLDRFMLEGHAAVGDRIVGVDLGVGRRARGDEPL